MGLGVPHTQTVSETNSQQVAEEEEPATLQVRASQWKAWKMFFSVFSSL